MIQLISLVIFNASLVAESGSVFVTAIAPIATALLGGFFTYLGLRLNNKAKQGDQVIASQAQQYEGMAMGQQFLKDALTESKTTITELKAQIAELQQENAELRIQNQEFDLKIRKIEEQLKNIQRDPGDQK